MMKRSFQVFPKVFSSKNRLVHTAAQFGFSEESSLSYEKGRPTYSEASLQQIITTFFKDYIAHPHPRQEKSSKSKINILEIGAGTGKFTESFVPYFLQTHYRHDYDLTWTALEPSDGFRETLKKKQIPNVTTVKGTADQLPIASNSIDAVVIAQAFHWMDNAKTLQDIHRVLRDHSPLFLIWNSYDYSKEWLQIVDKEILTPSYGDVPRQQSGKWRDCFFEEPAKQFFTPIHSWYHPYSFFGDRQMILDRFLSTSVIVTLPVKEKERVVQRIQFLLDHHPEFNEARKTGKYEIPYITHLAWVYKNGTIGV